MARFIDRYNRYFATPVLAWLIGINIAVFLAVWTVILSGNSIGVTGNFTISWLCVPTEPATVLTRPWTLLTYMVTQYDILHLLFNVLWLYWFGTLLASAVSPKGLAWLYVASGLAGGVLYVLTDLLWPELNNPGTYLCGASASVLGIMAAAAVMRPDKPVNLLLFGTVRLRWVALVCIILTFAGVGGGSTSAQSAHAGGVLCGALWGFISQGSFKPLKRRPRLRKPVRDGNAVAQAMAGRLADTSRLDILLDKIRVSGYNSLSVGERNELNELSRRLDDANSKN